MRISFDLDGVLFVPPGMCETEPPLSFPFNRLYPDLLRKGSVKLINTLQKNGVEVWIYTSSFRSERYIRNLFRRYGVRIDGVVNGHRHHREVQQGRKQLLPSKIPSRYKISLHIDDEDLVLKNGRSYGFRAMKITGPDKAWAEKILTEAKRIQNIERKSP